MNINKFLASSGFCSRRKADVLIKENKVTINNRPAKLTDKISANDVVEVGGKIISHRLPTKIYFAFNKPRGVISTTDNNSPNNIMNYIKISDRVFPVGRLDVASEGLILLTNDGDFANFILKEGEIEKEYLVSVDKVIDEHFLKKMADGSLRIDGFPVKKAEIKKIDKKTFSIIISEGRKRQIRRMCEKLNYNVVSLKRKRIGSITLDDILPGKYKEIPLEKIKNLIRRDY